MKTDGWFAVFSAFYAWFRLLVDRFHTNQMLQILKLISEWYHVLYHESWSLVRSLFIHHKSTFSSFVFTLSLVKIEIDVCMRVCVCARDFLHTFSRSEPSFMRQVLGRVQITNNHNENGTRFIKKLVLRFANSVACTCICATVAVCVCVWLSAGVASHHTVALFFSTISLSTSLCTPHDNVKCPWRELDGCQH